MKTGECPKKVVVHCMQMKRSQCAPRSVVVVSDQAELLFCASFAGSFSKVVGILKGIADERMMTEVGHGQKASRS